jgi:glyoxylase-like metal-dependent hydrolase (beta-lactamase superfamily II)
MEHSEAKEVMNQVTEHVYAVDADALNVFLIVEPEGLTLIDAGFPGTVNRVDEAVRSLGRRLDDVHDVLVTHCHPDHAAGLAELERATGAGSWMHPADAVLARAGEGFRPWEVSPGDRNRSFVDEIISLCPPTYEPAAVQNEVLPGDSIPVAGRIAAVGTPGHTAGHLVFLWPGDGGVLFVGDAANNVDGLQLSPVYEDLAEGLESLRRMGTLAFGTACFAHGPAIVGDAAAAFRKVWGDREGS